MWTQSVEILLVEDSESDVMLTQKALKSSKVQNELHTVSNGLEAMAYLRCEGKYKEAGRPDLILLDLNMPRMDGCEVLKEIKNDKDLQTIPVVILTTSDREQDILKTYKLHANCYIKKPVDFSQFVNVIRCLEEFWFNIVKLPPHS